MVLLLKLSPNNPWNPHQIARKWEMVNRRKGTQNTILLKKMPKRGVQKTLFWGKHCLKKNYFIICFFSLLSSYRFWPCYGIFAPFSPLFLSLFPPLSLYIYIYHLPLFRSLSMCLCLSVSPSLSLSLYLSLILYTSLSISLFLLQINKYIYIYIWL